MEYSLRVLVEDKIYRAIDAEYILLIERPVISVVCVCVFGIHFKNFPLGVF